MNTNKNSFFDKKPNVYLSDILEILKIKNKIKKKN